MFPRATAARLGSAGTTLDFRYGLLAFFYVGMVFWLGSRLGQAAAGGNASVRIAASLYHVPLFAGLGFLILQAISQGPVGAKQRWGRAAIAFAATGALAALYQWHHGPAPLAWHASFRMLLDLAGAAGLLIVCTLGADREAATG